MARPSWSIEGYMNPRKLQSVIDMGMEEGITQTWDRLEEYLASKQ